MQRACSIAATIDEYLRCIHLIDQQQKNSFDCYQYFSRYDLKLNYLLENSYKLIEYQDKMSIFRIKSSVQS